MRSEIGGSASARIRGPGAAALLTTTIAALCLLGLAPRPASGRSVAIVGNHFVDGQRVIRLIGVDRSGSEHACSGPLTGGGFGYGIFAGPRDHGDAELEGERRNARAQRCFFRLAKRVSGTTVSLGTMTSSPRPRPAGCRSVGNAVTRVARSRRLHLVRSGHRAGVTRVGVEEPHSGRLATADTDLPSLSYGHLVGDSAGPAQRAGCATPTEH
jgi:hypothetical protein